MTKNEKDLSKPLKAKDGRIISPETRLKLSKANIGKKRSLETRNKISIVHKGKKLSNERRQKISISQKERFRKYGPPKNWNLWTEERKLKMSKRLKGSNNHNWKGGRFIGSYGYVLILSPTHPNCDSKGYVKEHRLVMEQSLGRLLTTDEIVHHEDGNPSNNKIDNLKLFPSIKTHLQYHATIRKTVNGGI